MCVFIGKKNKSTVTKEYICSPLGCLLDQLVPFEEMALDQTAGDVHLLFADEWNALTAGFLCVVTQCTKSEFTPDS